MLLKAFNEEFLWKSTMERSGNTRKPVLKEPMVLPRINTIVGGTIPERVTIDEERQYRYSAYTRNYWLGVKERQNEYRLREYILRNKLLSNFPN